MAHQSPLHSLHEQAEASFLHYGADTGGAPVVETFGEIEAEYAALRKGCILLDNPHIATLRITGDDRIPFLNRMITQELATIRPYQTVHSFWLNRKGRIDADLRLANLPACQAPTNDPDNAPLTDPLITHEEGLLVAVDILCAPVVVQTLDAFIIADDVTITDITDRVHRLALHGPTAAALLSAVAQHTDGPPIADLNPRQSCRATIANCPLLIEREDETGEPGYHISMATEHAATVYHQLLETGRAHNGNDSSATNHDTTNHDTPIPAYRLRPAGWHAYNIARIEAGTPIYNIDFGSDNLPAETGVLHDRVSFRKGCYLGQEVVARMDALGHPKQTLIALRIPRAGHEANDWQPATGSPVLTAPDDTAEPKAVGRITSSTRSPMLGDDIIAFAQVKWNHQAPGTRLGVQTAGGIAQAIVSESLANYTKP